jgi:hypothetical protein
MSRDISHSPVPSSVCDVGTAGLYCVAGFAGLLNVFNCFFFGFFFSRPRLSRLPMTCSSRNSEVGLSDSRIVRFICLWTQRIRKQAVAGKVTTGQPRRANWIGAAGWLLLSHAGKVRLVPTRQANPLRLSVFRTLRIVSEEVFLSEHIGLRLRVLL